MKNKILKALSIILALTMIFALNPTGVKAAAASTLKITGAGKPTTITEGKAYVCTGTITSNYAIKSITGKISGSSYSKTVSVNTKSYNLKSSAIDKALLFNKLKPGDYTYVITAKDASNTTKTLVSAKFTVEAKPGTVYTPSASGKFTPACLPLKGGRIESLDKYSGGIVHNAADFIAGSDKNVYAIADGVVDAIYNGCPHVSAGKVGGDHKCVSGTQNGGNYVRIKHTLTNGSVYYSKYMHLKQNSITVKKGDVVKAGAKIGIIGSSGNSTGTHLHLGIGPKTNNEGHIETFGYYANNAPALLNGVKIRSFNASSGRYYASWIKNHIVSTTTETIGTYSYYTIKTDGTTSTTVTKPVVEKPAASTLSASGVTEPSTIQQGKYFYCKGTVTSNYNLNFVECKICYTDGTIIYCKNVNPGAKSYKIDGSVLDSAMLFNKLSPGTYLYVVQAKDTSGTIKVFSYKTFTVESTVKPAASTLNISDASAPSSITYGKCFVCKGNITSNYKLTYVQGIIMDTCGNLKYCKAVNPNAYSYNLKSSAIDCAMLFNKLSRGTYIYTVYAEDSSGCGKTFIYNTFTVN